jgi:hypothetical protein
MKSIAIGHLGRLVVSLALLGLPAAALAQYKLVTGSPKAGFAAPAASPRILRERPVALDLPSAAKAASEATATLEVAFFPDAVYNVLIKRSEATHTGGTAYSGSVAGFPQSIAVIVDNAGTVSLRVQVPGRRFSIRGSAETGYFAREHVDADPLDHDPRRMQPPEGGLREVPSALTKEMPVQVTPPEIARDDGTNIDVMIVYTQAARAVAGGAAQINADAAAEVVQTNTYYANSNVTQRLRLVYAGEVTYTEVDMDTDLPRVRGSGDGFMDEVPVLRDIYRADFVSLWGEYGGAFCGLGYLMSTEASTFAGSAYNTVA